VGPANGHDLFYEQISVMDVNEYDKHLQFDYVLCYYETNKKVAAFNLWDNGITAFRNAVFYKEWDRIGKLNPYNFAESIPYIKDSIIEKTRIITCFENFIKGQLILEEVLVHKVSAKHKQLASQQMERPIYTSELVDEDTFKYLDTKDLRKFDWTDFTIPFSWMMKESYQSKINLPPEILEALKSINAERNHLHFMNSVDFTWGPPIVEQYDSLINFVDTIMISCLDGLKQTLDDLKRIKSHHTNL